MPEHLPAHGNRWINPLLCFAFLQLLNCLYLNPWVVSLFWWFLILSPIPPGCWVGGCEWLSFWLGPTHIRPSPLCFIISSTNETVSKRQHTSVVLLLTSKSYWLCLIYDGLLIPANSLQAAVKRSSESQHQIGKILRHWRDVTHNILHIYNEEMEKWKLFMLGKITDAVFKSWMNGSQGSPS